MNVEQDEDSEIKKLNSLLLQNQKELTDLNDESEMQNTSKILYKTLPLQIQFPYREKFLRVPSIALT